MPEPRSGLAAGISPGLLRGQHVKRDYLDYGQQVKAPQAASSRADGAGAGAAGTEQGRSEVATESGEYDQQHSREKLGTASHNDNTSHVRNHNAVRGSSGSTNTTASRTTASTTAATGNSARDHHSSHASAQQSEVVTQEVSKGSIASNCENDFTMSMTMFTINIV
jgi:hypothetical protein